MFIGDSLVILYYKDKKKLDKTFFLKRNLTYLRATLNGQNLLKGLSWKKIAKMI